MRIASTIDAREVTHEGVTYTADESGVFEVPEQVGDYLTGFAVWLTEWQARDIEIAAARAEDTDASRMAVRIAELERQVAELQAAAAKPARRSRAKANADDATDDE